MQNRADQIAFAKDFIAEKREALATDSALFVAVSDYAFTKATEKGHIKYISDRIHEEAYGQPIKRKRGVQPKLDTHGTHYLYFLTIEALHEKFGIDRYSVDDGICAASILSEALGGEKYEAITKGYQAVASHKNYLFTSNSPIAYL